MIRRPPRSTPLYSSAASDVYKRQAKDLKKKLDLFWELSGEKIKLIDTNYDASKGSPVFTVNGEYSTRGWTEWTQGFQFGSAILQFDATGDNYFLESGKKATLEKMAPHISHVGVHDHGFNNVCLLYTSPSPRD